MGGQHRGIDIGAPMGADVRAPVTGIVSFVGQLPHEGRCLTIRTEGGYSITLVHLGSIALGAGTAVDEGEVVGTIGPSGEPEGPEPYVHLGIRLTADPNGYVDPLSLLPARAPASEPPPASQPQPPTAPPASEPAPIVSKRAPSASRSRFPRAPRQAPPRARPRATRSPTHSRRQVRVPRSAVTRRALSPTTSVKVSSSPIRAPGRAATGAPRTQLVPARQSSGAVRGPVIARRRGLRRTATSGRPGGGLIRVVLLAGLGSLGLALIAIGAAWWRATALAPRPGTARQTLRKMSQTQTVPEENVAEPPKEANPDRGRLALCERPATSRPCRRLRRALRHHGPLSPAPRRSRADGQRHRRARNAGDGRGRSRRSVAA